eukprot:10809987-Heterocapsa_arctica.AAC.1
MTPTPPRLCPFRTDPIAGANTASKPCLVAALLAPRTCFLESLVSCSKMKSSFSWTAHASPEEFHAVILA